MAQLQIIDTLDSFIPYWEAVKKRPQFQQIDAWHNHYMAHWPELRQKQLDNYAEEGEDWQEPDTLSGLMAHELDHLVHFHRRKLAVLADETGPWWQLYTEGFAQYSEQYILDPLRWHIHGEDNEDWLGWCEAKVNWLAGEFLRRVDEGEDMRRFFGSWFNLQGYKETGYFLGYHLINLLRQTTSLQEIALLTGIEKHLRPLLQTIS